MLGTACAGRAASRSGRLARRRFRDVDLPRRRACVASSWPTSTIDGDVERLTINGVDVGPSERRPSSTGGIPIAPAAAARPTRRGFRDGLGRRRTAVRTQTVARARRLDPRLLHESVDGEWSFIETLRHLVMATERWVHRAIDGRPGTVATR